MTKAAMIDAVYTEWKMVKTRSSLILCFEVPLERQAEVQLALGTPLPDQSIHVAIARLDDVRIEANEADKAVASIADDEPGKPPRPLSQLAAFLCTVVTFRRFLAERFKRTISGEEEAAQLVRDICRVSSRRELDTNTAAASAFRGMRADYRNWMNGIGDAA